MTARAEIAEKTRTAHEALHHHPVISRLLADDLSLPEYARILSVFRDVYVAAEERRCALGVWPEFSLARQCQALCQDAPSPVETTAHALHAITTVEEALGMLYALHGAQFGSAVISKHLKKSLPMAPMAYCGLRTEPDRWRSLVAELDRECLDTNALERASCGALHVFDLIASKARENAEAERRQVYT